MSKIRAEELQTILERLAQGESREVIARELRIARASLDQRFRRRNLFWNKWTGTYQEGNPMTGDIVVNGNPIPARAKRVLVAFENVKADKLLVANRLGFKKEVELDDFMSRYGLEWSGHSRSYIVVGA